MVSTWQCWVVLLHETSDRSQPFPPVSSVEAESAVVAAVLRHQCSSGSSTTTAGRASTTDAAAATPRSRCRVSPPERPSAGARRVGAPASESSAPSAPRRDSAGWNPRRPTRRRRLWAQSTGRESPAVRGTSRVASARQRSVRHRLEFPSPCSSVGFPSNWWSYVPACTWRGIGPAACRRARRYRQADPTHLRRETAGSQWPVRQGYSRGSTYRSEGRSVSRGSPPERGRNATGCRCKYAGARNSSTQSRSPAEHNTHTTRVSLLVSEGWVSRFLTAHQHN